MPNVALPRPPATAADWARPICDSSMSMPWTSLGHNRSRRSAAHAPQVSEHSVDDREAVLIFLWVVDNRLDNLTLGRRHEDCSSRLMDVR